MEIKQIRVKMSIKLVVLSVAVMCGYVQADLADGLISHWKLNGDAKDSIGNNHGTIYGAQWIEGKVGYALSFDGVNDYVDCGNHPSLSGMSDLTIAAWVRTDGYPATNFAAIVAKWHQDIHDTYLLAIDYRGYLYIAWHLEGYPHWGLPGFKGYNSGVAIEIGTWEHVTCARDGVSLKLYMNGNQIGTTQKIPDASFAVTNYNLRIGAQNQIRYGRYFNGSLDDVRIYDRALSAEEVLALYKEGIITVGLDIKPGSCPNPLNVKSRGVLPIAILGSEDFDVSSIDAVSIRLAGIAAIRSSLEDVGTPLVNANECECSTEGPDGYLDLALKFRTQEIVEQLIYSQDELAQNQTLALTLTGELFDDTSIEGTDCVFIVGKVPEWIAVKKFDANGDGVVNMEDFALLAEQWMKSYSLDL